MKSKQPIQGSELQGWHQGMLQVEKRVRDAHGEDGLRKFSGLNSDIDPVVLAQVAARFAPPTYSQRGYQMALVRAAPLLREAQSIINVGPTIFSMPPELIADLVWEGSSGYPKIVEINGIANPSKRFTERAKFITDQKRADRAETDLYEYWGDQAIAEGRSDVAEFKMEWREIVTNVRENPLLFLNMRSVFLSWKQQKKSAKSAEGAKKRGRKNQKKGK